MLDHFQTPFLNPVLIFAFLMGIILIIPLVFVRLRIPTIIGLILAGAAVGPNAGGLLNRDATIVLLGTIGLLYIVFSAGLGIDLNEFNKNRNRSLIFGAISFGFPQLIGAVAAHYFLGFSWTSSILLGSMFGSHTLLAYPIASRMGLTKHEAVIITVGGTIVTDVSALMVLAIISGTANGGIGLMFWVQLFVFLAIFVGIMLWLVPKIGRWFFRNASAGDIGEYLFVLTVVFTGAFLAEVAGLASIIGAFLAGLALNRLIPNQSSLMNRIEFVGQAIFIPFFLISVGMLVDVRVLFQGAEVVTVAISMVVLVTFGKWGASYMASKLFGFSSLAQQMMFGLSVPQAAATLAAVLVGFELGLLNEAVLNGTVIMILVSCFVGSWVTESAGRRLAMQEQLAVPTDAQANQRILVSVANPATVEKLADLALMLHNPQIEEPIRIISVVPEVGDVQASLQREEKRMLPAVQRITAANVPAYPITRIDMNPAQGILRTLTELRITHLIVGWNGRVPQDARIFGNILDYLLKQSRQLLLICKLDYPLNTMQRVVLVTPPNASHEPELGALLDTIKILCQQIGVKVYMMNHTNDSNALQHYMARTKPSVQTEFGMYNQWEDIPQQMGILSVDDLLMVVSARHDTVSWHSQLDIMPSQVAQQMKDNNFIIAYPALPNGSRGALERYNN